MASELQIAANNNDLRAVNRLIRVVSPKELNIRDKLGYTPLHYMVLHGNQRAFAKMILKGADHTMLTTDGSSLLHLIPKNATQSFVRAILAKNLNVNAQNEEGYAPIHHALLINNTYLFKALLQRKADPHVIWTKTGDNSLHLAAARANEEALTLLLSRNVAVDKQTKEGFTALHYAAEKGHTNIIQHLLDSKADPNIKSIDGHTPLHIAVVNFSAENNTSLTIRQLAKEDGVNIDEKNHKGKTALQLAVDNGDTEIVNILLDAGADINTVKNNGLTPLDTAYKKKNSAMISLLEAYSAKRSEKSSTVQIKDALKKKTRAKQPSESLQARMNNTISPSSPVVAGSKRKGDVTQEDNAQEDLPPTKRQSFGAKK